MNELLDIVSSPKDEHAVPVDAGHPPSVWFLLGLIAGCIAAVFLVSHLNSQKLQNKRKGANNKNRAPSSGSPVESLDEEKTA